MIFVSLPKPLGLIVQASAHAEHYLRGFFDRIDDCYREAYVESDFLAIDTCFEVFVIDCDVLFRDLFDIFFLSGNIERSITFVSGKF